MVDTRLFGGVGKVDFRRTESFISRPRTGQKEDNIEFQQGSVVYFGVPICEYIGFRKCHIFRRKYVYLSAAGQISLIFTTKTAPAARGGLQQRGTSGRAGKTHVAPEYAILAEKYRVIGDASGKAPVYASRGYRINGVENCFTRQSARPLLRMLGRSAAADRPGLRPFRRGSWK